MHNALHPAGLCSQDRQGVTARFIHRLGGAMRGAIARLRRPAPPPSTPQPRPAEKLNAPAPPRRPRAPRRPRTAPPTRPGWIARWFGRKRSLPAASRRQPLTERDDAPFTPETHPHFGPEVCELLNTPVGDCDPALLREVFRIFAACVADQLPPELGLNDPRALFATLWGQLADAIDQPAPDAAPDARAPGAQRSAATAVTALDTPRGTIVLPTSGRRASSRSRNHRRFARRRCALPSRAWRKPRRTPPPQPRPYDACAGPP